MGKSSKAVLAILAALPVLAFAQARQGNPEPQSGSAISVPGTASQPKHAASADAKRLVTNESFVHAPSKPHPGTSAPVNTQSASGTPAFNPAPAAVRPGSVPAVPQPIQRVIVISAPAMVRAPQPAQPQPAVITSTATAEHSSSAAVDYAFGKLTVVADNAPLGTVLKLIAAKTGAVVDLAPELQNEPVAARLGPDSVREVLTGLLDSPRIDYIVFGTGDEPGSLQRILVRTRQSFGKLAIAATHPAQPQPEEDGNQVPRQAGPAQAQISEEQRLENWRKAREEMIQAEIKQQAEDRETEKTQPSPEQPSTQAQDNPPQQ